MSTYTKVLGVGEDITVLAPAGQKLTHTQLTNANTRIRIAASGTVVPPPPPPDPPPGAPPAFGSRPASARMDRTGESNIVIENKTFTGTAAGLAAIRLTSCTNVTIRNCDFIDVPGCIYAYQSSGIVIEDCRYSNITGPHARTGANVGNFVQTNECSNVTIRRNKGKGGDTEDIVSVYKTSTALVEDNHFEGTGWTSGSGSGIALGDYGGSGNIARRNILVNPGQVGAFIAGGTNHTIQDNIIIGQQRAKSNVGVYVWGQGGGACSGHTVGGNRASWTAADGSANPYWNKGNCGPVAGSPANDWYANLDIELYRVVL